MNHIANIAALPTADEVDGYQMGLEIQGALTVELQQALARRRAEIAKRRK